MEVEWFLLLVVAFEAVQDELVVWLGVLVVLI